MTLPFPIHATGWLRNISTCSVSREMDWGGLIIRADLISGLIISLSLNIGSRMVHTWINQRFGRIITLL